MSHNSSYGWKKEEKVINEPEIIFEIDSGKIITMTNDGIKIHRENFPNFNPDDFVKAFLYILENLYTVKFERKAEVRPETEVGKNVLKFNGKK